MHTHIDVLIISPFSFFLFISIFTSFFFARYVLCAILLFCVCRCISHWVCCSFAKNFFWTSVLDYEFTSEKLRQFHHPTKRRAYWEEKMKRKVSLIVLFHSKALNPALEGFTSVPTKWDGLLFFFSAFLSLTSHFAFYYNGMENGFFVCFVGRILSN